MDTASGRLQVMLERLDPARNMYRYYVIALEPTLFGDTALVRQWGRIGARGVERRDEHPDETAASAAMERLAASKRRRGYRDL